MERAAGLDEAGLWSAPGLRLGYATTAHDAGHNVLAIGRHGEGWVDGSRALFGYIDVARRRTNNPVPGLAGGGLAVARTSSTLSPPLALV